MRKNSNCYDEISVEMLELLTEFSDYINRMSVLNETLLTNDLFNRNPHFIQYIYYFGLGRYYHFRCMGYMEALVLTKCYSVKSLCYWKEELVMPASENFMKALEYLDKLKTDSELSSNPVFKVLIRESEGFMKVSMEIMELIKRYNLPC